MACALDWKDILYNRAIYFNENYKYNKILCILYS